MRETIRRRRRDGNTRMEHVIIDGSHLRICNYAYNERPGSAWARLGREMGAGGNEAYEEWETGSGRRGGVFNLCSM